MKLGSLFDGSGGFPLAATMCGITPVWASEIEPYPIAVTKSRFPKMKHLGDISKINGGEIEPVDIITFGSPCQDLSVAGKRAGLKHETNGDDETTRSGLFMEAVRIIKEMRKATNGKFPTSALWENVPGAFSSNKGEDFRIVLEELIKIAEPDAVMPAVPKNGWAYADFYCGNGWSIGYRVFDAQFWGVPQRRRRIYLVADFRGERAREILFEREGLRWYFAQGGTPWQRTAEDVKGSIGTDDRTGAVGIDLYNAAISGTKCVTLTARADATGTGPTVAIPYTLKIRSGCEGGGKGALVQKDKSATLATNNDQYLFQPISNLLLDDQGGQQINVRTDEKAPTLRAETHGNIPAVVCKKQPLIFDARGNGDGKIASTITGDHENRITDYTNVVCANVEEQPIPIHDQATRFCGKRGNKCDGKGNGLGVGKPGDPMNTLTSADRHAVAYRQGGFADYVENEVGTLKASGGDLGGGSESLIVEEPQYIVRRLTPTECARLQGFPDRWGDIDSKDSLTEEEFRFWQDVRNTHAAINGKQVKEYTEKQMLSWYQKLHTDSAEYKMWGNGIALPTALYCMQGIAEALG